VKEDTGEEEGKITEKIEYLLQGENSSLSSVR
jgi:hypothetical protein